MQCLGATTCNAWSNHMKFHECNFSLQNNCSCLKCLCVMLTSLIDVPEKFPAWPGDIIVFLDLNLHTCCCSWFHVYLTSSYFEQQRQKSRSLPSSRFRFCKLGCSVQQDGMVSARGPDYQTHEGAGECVYE
jgi:hypothetical protein